MPPDILQLLSKLLSACFLTLPLSIGNCNLGSVKPHVIIISTFIIGVVHYEKKLSAGINGSFEIAADEEPLAVLANLSDETHEISMRQNEP